MVRRTQKNSRTQPDRDAGLPKTPTGIAGLDEITRGGLPTGRPTLVCGGAGCGKTMLAAEFLVRGATEFGEPGVFMSFEESGEDLAANMRSLGFDLVKLQRDGLLAIDHVKVERSEIEETGEYDLEGLFIRLGHAIDRIGAKRVVLDTLEALFAGLPNPAVLRSELRRLFHWLKERGMTAVVTAERGDNNMLTRYGMEEYVADCVLLLDQRIVDQVSTRRMRVVKYRGSSHGTNEYPFLISDSGLSVLPITSTRLDHPAYTERVSTGVRGLDEMLGGQGVYRGGSVLVSGSAGTGKSTLAACFVDAACRRGERAVLFAYEESAPQLLRNMRSVGLDLERWVKKGLLDIQASRPALHGLEQHLVQMYDTVSRIRPQVVAVDPISNLTIQDADPMLKAMLVRLVDFLKYEAVTSFFTTLTHEGSHAAELLSEIGVSSMMDTWVVLSNHEYNGERTRTVQLPKSRGMAHSSQVREFVFGDHGVDLVDVFVSGQRVLTGAARQAQQARETAESLWREREHAQRLQQLADQRQLLDAQIAGLRAEADAREAELGLRIEREGGRAAAAALVARKGARDDRRA